MSTRRTTRAASRQASSRAVSPAASVATTATPRRNRRAGNEALPAVGLRQSTAYGTNTTAQPARITGPVVSDQINSVLRDLLTPDPHSHATSSSAQEETPFTDKSYGIESGLFHGARVDSSVPSSPSEHARSPEPPTASAGQVTSTADAEVKELEVLARKRLASAGYAAPCQNVITSAPSKLWSAFRQLIDFLLSLAGSIFNVANLPYLVLLLVGILFLQLWSGGSFSDLGETATQYIPHGLKNPLDLFSPDDIRVINRRIGDLEYQVARIKNHVTEIDSRAISHLEQMLPDLLVVKKDKYQNMIIPDDFWVALQDKIRSDDTLMRERFDEPVQIGKGAVSGKELNSVVEKAAKTAWDRYIKQNQNNMKGILADELGQKFPRLLQDHHVATKDEVVELLRQNWDENSSHLQTELSQLSKKVENASRMISKLQHASGTITKEEVKAIATDTLKKIIPHAQLEALATANLRGAVESGLTRLNHFSKATGATIDPYLTSPTYSFPTSDVWFPNRWFRSFIGNPIPQPNPPEAALSRWEEYGDCWCAPAKDEAGLGPSLGVIAGTNLYPEQVVVEHIPAISTLQPGAAPRDMELLAYIPDLETYNAVKTASGELFPDDEPETQHPYRYIRIATWTYDNQGPSAQAFKVQVDMAAFGASTNKLVVRAKDNWGGDAVEYTCMYRIRLNGEVAPTTSDL